jgi:hypothetical protein
VWCQGGGGDGDAGGDLAGSAGGPCRWRCTRAGRLSRLTGSPCGGFVWFGSAVRTTDGPPAAMPRRRAGLSRLREPDTDLSGTSPVFLRDGSHRTGRVRVRDHPQLAADGCGRPGYPHRPANPAAFRAQLRPRPGTPYSTARLQGRGPDVTAAGAGRTGLAGGSAGRAGQAPRGEFRAGAPWCGWPGLSHPPA